MPSFAFVSPPSDRNGIALKTSLPSPFVHPALYVSVRSKLPSLVLDSLLSYNETTYTPDFNTVDFPQVTKNTVFPSPPAAPTNEELYTNGLPILVEAAKHAKAGRMMCYELPENGNVGISYHTVMQDTANIADHIVRLTKSNEKKEGKPRTVAHLTEPGSEYLSSMWGVSDLLAKRMNGLA